MIVVALAAVALALPSTVQFAWKKATLPYDPVPAPMVRAMDALAAASQPGDVVLQRPGAPVSPAARRPRRPPRSLRAVHAVADAVRAARTLARRHEAVFRFFRTTDRGEAMAIARELDARFVALYGADRLRFDTAGALETDLRRRRRCGSYESRNDRTTAPTVRRRQSGTALERIRVIE